MSETTETAGLEPSTTEVEPQETFSPEEARRERLSATFDAITDRKAAEADGNATDAAIARARGEGGRFAPKPGEAPPEPIGRPEWLKSQKLDWNRLPRDVQSEIAALQAQAPQPEQTPDPYRAIMEPHASYFQQRGIDPQQGAASVMQIYRALEANPLETLQWLAQNYRVNLGAPAPAPQQQAPAAQGQEGNPSSQTGQQFQIEDHPAFRQVRDELNRLREEHAKVSRSVHNNERMAVARQYAEASAEVQRFISDPDNPKPHFDAVREEMSHLLQAGKAKTIPEAYDMACWMNPKVRTLMQEADRKTALEKQRAELEAQRKKAAQDRLIAAKNRVPVVNGAASAKGAGLRETLERVAGEIQTRN